MNIAVERVGDVAVAAVPVEELDAGITWEFKRDMAPVLEANTKVVLDLSQVRLIDSSGLGSLLAFLRKLYAKGGDLKLFGLSNQVRTAMELLRMNRLLDIFTTREEAVRAFQVRVPVAAG